MLVPDAPETANKGAAAAARLEWGVRPALLAEQVSAACKDGLLRTSDPRSATLRRPDGWPERWREPPFNLFWADLEADVAGRVATFLAAPRRAPPITRTETVGRNPPKAWR